MKLNASKPGTYRFLIQFFKENKKDEILGKYEFTFVIGTPDLNMYIVMDGKRIDNLYGQQSFLETDGEFLVRVLSEKEDLNKGRLTLTANITGSSVQVLNWKDRESKISQSDDLPQTVDFLVQYKNILVGKTRFFFTAQSQNSSAILKDSINIVENKPGTLTFAATYDEETNFYSRPQLWVGQTDSVDYIIQKDPESNYNAFRIMFEMKDPTKLWFFNTGDESKQNASTNYEANKWYDFSDKMTGKLYYMFPSPQTYQDTVYISLQNGTQGKIIKYKLFLSCKQSDDFDFSVAFKTTLVNGYDEIKLSELKNGVDDLVTLSVSDKNPYSQFDYELGGSNINDVQRNIVQTALKEGYPNLIDLPYGEWLGRDFGYLFNTKTFKVICNILPNDANADGYIGTFNWTYTLKRASDDKRKSVTRQIKIIDDRLSFLIDMAPGNSRESIYQNETITAYQLKYKSPSLSAEDYVITITSSNEDIADVYLVNKDLTFRKVTFGAAETSPASHNPSGSMLAVSEIGKIQIKGKQPGTAILSFTLKHKISGASGTITKTVTTIADPVQYVIEPAPTLDFMSKERTAIPFGGQFHTYQNPRFKIRLNKASGYSANTSGTASVVFTTIPSLTNVAKLTVRGGAFGNPGYHNSTNAVYGTAIELAYNTDYFVTVATPTSLPWTVPVGSEQFLNIKMIKATNQQTQIEEEYNDRIKYKLRAYQRPSYTITGEPYNESACIYNITEMSDFPVYVSEAKVVLFPTHKQVTKTICSGTFQTRNLSVSNLTKWNDGNELYGQPSLTESKASSYFREKTEGDRMEAIPGETPSNPSWNYYGPSVTVTYYGATKATVRDNWGCSIDVFLLLPSKIVYGNNP
jgi:hypothetical protein